MVERWWWFLISFGMREETATPANIPVPEITTNLSFKLSGESFGRNVENQSTFDRKGG